MAPRVAETRGSLSGPASRRVFQITRFNGQPFRLVLDAGASDSAITAPVADALGLTPNLSHPVLVHGVAGSAVVPTVHVDSITVGDLDLISITLPIVADALGGVHGVLGTAGFTDKHRH